MHFLFVACNKNKNVYRTDPSYIYRCENLAYGIEMHGHTFELLHLSDFQLTGKMDAVLFHRPRFSFKLWLIIQFLKFKHIFHIVDVDDFIFDESFANASPAFKNNILSLKKVKKQFSSNLKALKLFTNFSVSTVPLKEHLMRLLPSSKVVVNSNAVHYTWKEKEALKTSLPQKTISYFPGTKSHDKDFTTIEKPLTRFLKKHSDIALKITGPLNFKLDIPEQQIIYNEKVPFAEHWKNYQNVWINLAPLEESVFNQCKSALKVIEAGFFQVPTISINNSDTQRFINRGALIAGTEQEFFDYLEKCLDEDYYSKYTSNLQNKIVDIADVEVTSKRFINFVKQNNSIFYARKRRNNGFYDLETLKFYLYSWRKTKDMKIYVEYCMFCRDLGYSLSIARERRLNNIRPQLNSKAKSNADILLMEAHNTFKSKKKYLLDIFKNQKNASGKFKDYIKNKKICVVGNSANIREKSLGGKIDSNDIVLRFNNCCSKKYSADLGERTNIWVTAPDIKDLIDEPWIIVSGPNMIYRGAKWSRFSKVNLDNNNIITVPLEIWKKLVSILHAPPNAGILTLYWLKSILEDWENISIAGFDLKITNDIYHYADDTHKAGIRHNWKKEKELLSQWVNEGLEVVK